MSLTLSGISKTIFTCLNYLSELPVAEIWTDPTQRKASRYKRSSFKTIQVFRYLLYLFVIRCNMVLLFLNVCMIAGMCMCGCVCLYDCGQVAMCVWVFVCMIAGMCMCGCVYLYDCGQVHVCVFVWLRARKCICIFSLLKPVCQCVFTHVCVCV